MRFLRSEAGTVQAPVFFAGDQIRPALVERSLIFSLSDCVISFSLPMPGCSSCVLYVRGRNFDVERFLRRYSLEPDHVWRRTDPPILKKRTIRFSGFSIYIG